MTAYHWDEQVALAMVGRGRSKGRGEREGGGRERDIHEQAGLAVVERTDIGNLTDVRGHWHSVQGPTDRQN